MKNWEFRCGGCNAQLTADLSLVGGLVECKYCHRQNPVPRKEASDELLNYLHDGTSALDVCKFEDAFTYFQRAAELDPNEPEAFFGMALATFRVQYLKDEVNDCLQPICHEISEKAFTEDRNYKKALEFATVEQKKVYRRKGGEIDDIRDEFFRLKSSGLSYDCFLCAKVTEEDGRTRTEDNNRANDIYYHLKDSGYKPFFSEREMKGRTGSAYEALILYALFTSECMLIVCSNEDYLQTKWVKNEYTRFLGMMQEGGKERDAVTFVFAGNPIEKLPNGKKIQGIDLTKPDAYTRITEYVEKQVRKIQVKETAETQNPNGQSFSYDELARSIENERLARERDEKESALLSSMSEEVRDHYEKALKGDTLSQGQLAYAFESGEGVTQNGEKALYWYHKAAEQGEMYSQCSLGLIYQQGELVPQNYEESAKWFEKSAEQGYALAQFELGRYYMYGQGVMKDPQKAIELLTKSADQGEADAQFALGAYYADGKEVGQDYQKATSWLLKAANQDHAMAQYYLGLYHILGRGVEQDYFKAVEWFAKAAKQGHAEAQYQLAMCYCYGDGCEQDFGKAVELFKKSADQGCPQAQFEIGTCYENGEEVEQDYFEAARYYELAARQGNKDGKRALAMCYFNGCGVPKDQAKAVELMLSVAKQGDACAQLMIGAFHMDGVPGAGIPKNPAKAIEWYLKSAEKGYEIAQLNLGDCYEHGVGVPRDINKAIAWYEKAADQGNAEAQEALNRLYRSR